MPPPTVAPVASTACPADTIGVGASACSMGFATIIGGRVSNPKRGLKNGLKRGLIAGPVTRRKLNRAGGFQLRQRLLLFVSSLGCAGAGRWLPHRYLPGRGSGATVRAVVAVVLLAGLFLGGVNS